MNNLIINKNEEQKLIFQDIKDKEQNIKLEDNAKLNLLYFSRIEEDLNINVDVLNDCNLEYRFILLNQNSKINLNVNILGSNSNVDIKVLSLALNTKKEFNVKVVHYAPNSNSLVTNSGISFARGHHIFNIIGEIKPNMALSNARQLTRGIILDETGSCKALPILLIDNYDVKAYHGATIGKINDDDLFYLMSRGLTKKEAFMLIINGILEPFVNAIDDENVKEMIMNKYSEYFGE